MTRSTMLIHLTLTSGIACTCLMILLASPRAGRESPSAAHTRALRAAEPETRRTIDPHHLASLFAPVHLTRPQENVQPLPQIKLSALLRQGSSITGVLMSSPEFGSSPVLAPGDSFAGATLIEQRAELLIWSHQGRMLAMDFDGNWLPAGSAP